MSTGIPLDLFEMPPLPPEATLMIGPVGGGKTQAAIQAIHDTRALAGFHPVWVLLAHELQIHSFRQRLLATSDDAVQFGVEFFNFDGLYRRVLDMAGDPQRHVEDTARFQVLRHVIAGLRAQGELEHFEAISMLPGFIGLVAGLIHELKQGLVEPEKFAQVAEARGPKDRDLARIYAAYQDFLRERNLVDRHGAGWLALHHLESRAQMPGRVELLVVDGFDQFNRVNLRVITALAALLPRTVVTLTEAPDEPGRQFRRFAQTYQHLLALGADKGQKGRQLWNVETLPVQTSPQDATRAPALSQLVTRVFSLRNLSRDGQALNVPGEGALHLIEAPDPAGEVRAVLRRVKHLLLGGVQPEQIAVVARSLLPYSDALRETAAAYGLPLVVREGLRLAQNPLIALLLDLIDLAAQDFPRRALLDTLRSPYFSAPDLTAGQVNTLERISQEFQVVGGREHWLSAIHEAALPVQTSYGEPRALLAPQKAAELAEALSRHFVRLTPPPRATVYALVTWLAGLIGPDPAASDEDRADAVSGFDLADLPAPDAHFHVIRNVRQGREGPRTARDLAALRQLLRVLRGIRAAHDLLAGVSAAPEMDWYDFRVELGLAVERATLIPPGGLSRLGRVLATDVLEARGLPHQHVFILGLAEGQFPLPEPEGALYVEGERHSLEAAGIDMLTVAERADDMTLFYQAIGLARHSLTLSRTTVDGRGNPLPPSPYWDAVCAVVDVPEADRLRIGTGAAPSLDEAASLSEAAVALAAVFSGERVRDDDQGHVFQQAQALHNALLATRGWDRRWRRVLAGRALESRREDPHAPLGHYDGVLRSPALIARVAELLGPDRVWSASQFNEYGTCGFHFFGRRLLQIEELRDPEDGLDAMQVGSINHAVLEAAYDRIARAELGIAPENREAALSALEDAAAEVFASAPQEYGFRPSPLWDQEFAGMLDRLRWLVALDFSEESPLRPQPGRKKNAVMAEHLQAAPRVTWWQEAAFGLDGAPPLAIDGPAGVLRARGKIDRMDRAGDQVVVMDYKTGSTPHPVSDMESGRDVQMMLYILAARQLLANLPDAPQVAGGLFWHINNRKISGDVLADDSVLEQAREVLHHNVLAARSGRFGVKPQGARCPTHCEFSQMCRVSRAYHRKDYQTPDQAFSPES